jgi:colicin import membrane protein
MRSSIFVAVLACISGLPLISFAQADSPTIQPQPVTSPDSELLARYVLVLRQVIESNWVRPDTVPLGAKCRVAVRQAPGGEVVYVKAISPCAYDEQGRRSIEAAVLKANPLPYAGFEAVFVPSLQISFRAEDRAGQWHNP